ncbi:hypothetical protein ACWGLO_08540 [Streptomyces niveus]
MTAVLGAVGAGMANEVGKRGLETAGGLVRRIAGREVAAPADPDQIALVARIVYDGVHRDPALARAWQVFARTVPETASTTTYRALTERQLAALVTDAGFDVPAWRQPEGSGFFRPLLTARRHAAP